MCINTKNNYTVVKLQTAEGKLPVKNSNHNYYVIIMILHFY